MRFSQRLKWWGLAVALAGVVGLAGLVDAQIAQQAPMVPGSTNNGITTCQAVAPTISSGFGTSPAILSSNGSCTFRINVGTGGVATSGVVGLPTATNGWNCLAIDQTNNTVTRQTAGNTTTVTLTAAAAWAASDTLALICQAY